MLTAIHKIDVVNEAVVQLVGMISTMQPGERLPSERDLSLRLGISRASVREALRVLIFRGLIETRGGRGRFVASPGSAAREIQPDDQQSITVEELFEARSFVEPYTAHLAALRASEQNLAALKSNLDAQRKALLDADLFPVLDATFHVLVATAAGNAAFLRMLESFLPLMTSRMQQVQSADVNSSRAALREHRDVYEAIVSRDSSLAESAMARHVKQQRTPVR